MRPRRGAPAFPNTFRIRPGPEDCFIGKPCAPSMALELGFIGAAVGLLSFLIIGVLHPVVIKTEYHFGKRAWPVFAVAGAVALAGSLLCGDVVVSIILGILSFSLFWSIKELYDQEERVRKGWYPENPDRKRRTRRGRPVSRITRFCPSSPGTQRMSLPATGALRSDKG